jgi:predicted DCC family thiol-disulfide oxidoreductase YuxK
MPTLHDHPLYSWRSDTAVPGFDDSRPLIVFDGVCVFCSHSMHFIARNGRNDALTFTAAQSALGQALYRHFRLDLTEFETVLILDGGRAYGHRDAMLAIGRHLKQPWRSAMMMWHLLPGRLGNAAYEMIATRRYRIFGRTQACFIPDASWRARVIP